MGGLPPEDPCNAIGGGVKRAWSYLKLLHTELTGIPTLFWNNQVCASNHAKADALRQQYESLHAKTYVLCRHLVRKILAKYYSDSVCAPAEPFILRQGDQVTSLR